MMTLFYNLGILLYDVIIWLISPYHQKAGLLYKGRKTSWNQILQLDLKDKHAIWVHCSSLGEFEQGRPVIEGIKQKDPNRVVVLTFYSPSGFEIRKNYEYADYVFYLPSDRPRKVKAFIKRIKPSYAVFVKYEFWFNYLKQLNKQQVKTYIISSIFRKDQVFFKWYGGWYRNILKYFDWLFVQDDNSGSLLKSIGIENYSVDGDTRFDRVKSISQNSREYTVLKNISENAKVIVGGSTWPEDERLLAEYLKVNKDVKLLLAPHEIHEEHIVQIEKLFGIENTQRFTDLKENDRPEKQVIIVNTMGMLSSMYRYGNVAHIGGGFGTGIHNTLEAATFGLPVTFGPNYKRFKEAVELVDQQAAFVVTSLSDYQSHIDSLLTDPDALRYSSDRARAYVDKMCGATEKILQKII